MLLFISDVGWIEVLEILYKVVNNYSFNALIFSCLTNIDMGI